MTSSAHEKVNVKVISYMIDLQGVDVKTLNVMSSAWYPEERKHTLREIRRIMSNLIAIEERETDVNLKRRERG